MNGVARLPAILIAGKMEAKAGVGRDEFRATLETSSGCPVTTYGWDFAETREGPTCGRSANRACQLASSWSRNDHEDGGPTIQLPAADARCTLRSLSCIQYMRRAGLSNYRSSTLLAESTCYGSARRRTGKPIGDGGPAPCSRFVSTGGKQDRGTVCVSLIPGFRPTSLPIPEPNTAAAWSRDSRDPQGCRMPS